MMNIDNLIDWTELEAQAYPQEAFLNDGSEDFHHLFEEFLPGMLKPQRKRPACFLVKPGRFVGDFVIGSKISEAFNYIRRNSDVFPSVEFKFNEADPLSMALSLELKLNGIELRFDSRTQRLELIRIYDLALLELAYGNEDRVFSSPESMPSLQIIYDKFGPTFAGRYSPDKSDYVLEYPGLAFTFPIPEDKKALADVQHSEMPRSLDIRLKTIHVWREGERPSSPVRFIPSPVLLMMSDLVVVANVGEGITIMPEPTNRVANQSQSTALGSPQSSMIGGVSFSSRSSWTLDFNSSVQDVLQAVGEPDQMYYKTEDPLSIHKADDSPNLDYFFNYFRFGFDILFDGTLHKVKKYILWTNMPSQPLFTKYEKCNFQIIAPEWTQQNRKRVSAMKVPAQKRKFSGGASMGPFSSSPNKPKLDINLEPGKELLDFSEEHQARNGIPPAADQLINDEEDSLSGVITPDMKWSEVEVVFGPPIGKPFLAPGQEYSPFVGGTAFYAYKDIIFEVMENDYMVKVILFKT